MLTYRDSLSDLVPQFMNYINAGQLIPSVKEIRMRMALHRFLDRESWCRIQKITYYCLPIWTVSTQLFICFTAPYARFLCHKDKTNAYGKQHGFQEFMETLSKGGSFQVHLSCPGKVLTCCRHRQRRRGGMVCGTNWAVVSDRG